MSTDTTPLDEESWRGVAAEEQRELDHTTGMRLHQRSRRLLAILLRPRRGLGGLVLAISIAENALALAGPALIAIAIDRGIPAASKGAPMILTLCIAGYLGAGLFGAGCRYLVTRLVGRIGQDFMLDLRGRIFRHAQKLSLQFHEDYTSGKVISRLTSDLDALENLLEMGLDELFSALFATVGILIAIFFLDVELALIVVAVFIPLLLVTRNFYQRSQRAYRDTRLFSARIVVQLVESLTGIRAVLSYRRESRNAAIMVALNESYREAGATALVAIARFASTVRVLGNLTLAGVLALGGAQVIGGSLAVGVLAAFILYLRRLYDPLDDIAMFANAYTAASASLEKISGLLEEPPTVTAAIDPTPLPAARGAVGFRQVSFRYQSGTPLVLPPFRLDIPPGQSVALV
ncbi:MAG: ABC transporter transmembrane domain-containing protein, partial [Sciscionella sp.]